MRKITAIMKSHFRQNCRSSVEKVVCGCFLVLSFSSANSAIAAHPSIMAFDASSTTTETNQMKNAATHLNVISGHGFIVGANGSITENPNPHTVSAAINNNIQYLVQITNQGFDPQVARAMFASTTIISDIVALTTRSNVAGISINVAGVALDLEGMNETDRNNYTDFVTRLSSALQSNGKILMISVAAKEQDYATGWTAPYDYAALASLPITMQIMTYDQHSSAAIAGSGAGLNWVQNCLNYALSALPVGAGVPASKISMGMPAYGRDWNVTTHVISQMYVSWNAIPALVAQTGATDHWDTLTSTPYLTYTDANHDNHQLWYENGASIRAKAALATSLGVAGISVFSDEKTDSNFWPALIDGTNKESALIGSINNLMLR